MLIVTLTACPDSGTEDDTGADTAGTDTTGGTMMDGTTPGTMTNDTTAGTMTAETMEDDTSDDGPTDDTAGACEPVEWSAPDWDANTADALAIRGQLDTLTGDTTMRGAETGAVKLGSVDDLTAVWDGDPSLAAVANPGYVPIVEECFSEFISVLEVGETDLVDGMGLWDPGPDGGIWGENQRGINEGGLEVRQLVDKGGYSAGVNYAYAVSLTEGDISAATIDAIAAIWGNNADLDPEGDLTDAAGYAYSMGFHAAMAESLAAAKSFAGNADCTAELDSALVRFFQLWEQTMYARVVFYGNRAEGKLLEDDQVGTLHDLAEAIGLAAGFIGMPDPESGPLSGQGRIITDDQVEQVMAAFGVDLSNLGASTTGLFVENLPNLETAVGDSESIVMEVYGVSEDDIAGYADPTPG